MAAAKSLISALIFYYICGIATSFSVFEIDKPTPQLACDDCGDPLILTPYIKNGQVKKARELARVDHPAFRGVNGYSGYFTVNEDRGSNMFFWYFEAATNQDTAPVVLWLQGGPGASSLFGLFSENGPFFFKKDRIRPRYYSWHKFSHLIYIDNPVGTGYSFTKDGYVRNQTAVGIDLYSAMQQFFTLFPYLQKNPFYVTGESYAGKYVPALCYTIHKKNPNATMKINLQGFATGNGFSDPLHQSEYADYLYQLGFVDSNDRDKIFNYEEQGKKYIQQAKWKEATEVFNNLVGGNTSMLYNITNIISIYNYVKTKELSDDFYARFLQLPDVRKAIHVGNRPYNNETNVMENLAEDMMKSVAPWIGELLSYYRGLIYSGQFDIIVAYPLTENFLKNLNFSSADDFKSAVRKPWTVDGMVAGYMKTAGNLTEVLVRNAGHMAPADQPKWLTELISRFTYNKSL